MVCNLTAPLPLHHDHHCTAIKVNWPFWWRAYVLCTSCSLGITHTNFKQTFWLCSAATNDVMRLFSPTNYQLHITHVAYQHQSKYFNLTPIFAFTNFTKKKRGISIFRMNQSKPVFAKNAPTKKLTTNISRQTEFTMSRRLSAHNYFQQVSRKNSEWAVQNAWQK